MLSKIFASQAEALLRLGRHGEAESVLKNAPKFDTDAIINFFSTEVNGYILMIQAEVYLASGRSVLEQPPMITTKVLVKG